MNKRSISKPKQDFSESSLKAKSCFLMEKWFLGKGPYVAVGYFFQTCSWGAIFALHLEEMKFWPLVSCPLGMEQRIDI